jgi:hypothetical protein
MRLREAFSSFFSSWLLFCEGRSNLKAQDFLDAQRGHAANKTAADSLAVAVVLTLEFAEIASVRVHPTRPGATPRRPGLLEWRRCHMIETDE